MTHTDSVTLTHDDLDSIIVAWRAARFNATFSQLVTGTGPTAVPDITVGLDHDLAFYTDFETRLEVTRDGVPVALSPDTLDVLFVWIHINDEVAFEDLAGRGVFNGSPLYADWQHDELAPLVLTDEDFDAITSAWKHARTELLGEVNVSLASGWSFRYRFWIAYMPGIERTVANLTSGKLIARRDIAPASIDRLALWLRDNDPTTFNLMAKRGEIDRAKYEFTPHLNREQAVNTYSIGDVDYSIETRAWHDGTTRYTFGDLNLDTYPGLLAYETREEAITAMCQHHARVYGGELWLLYYVYSTDPAYAGNRDQETRTLVGIYDNHEDSIRAMQQYNERMHRQGLPKGITFGCFEGVPAQNEFERDTDDEPIVVAGQSLNDLVAGGAFVPVETDEAAYRTETVAFGRSPRTDQPTTGEQWLAVVLTVTDNVVGIDEFGNEVNEEVEEVVATCETEQLARAAARQHFSTREDVIACRVRKVIPSPRKKTDEEIAQFILNYGANDGAHHKQWVLDQVLRMLTGDKYRETVSAFMYDHDGQIVYEWETGVAP